MSNLSDAVKHNTYFEGRVQSLALDTEKGPATVGVMKKGEYLFNTSTPETITIISGVMNTKVGDAAWEKHLPGQTFHLPAGIAFDVDCEADVAYICYYA